MQAVVRRALLNLADSDTTHDYDCLEWLVAASHSYLEVHRAVSARGQGSTAICTRTSQKAEKDRKEDAEIVGRPQGLLLEGCADGVCTRPPPTNLLLYNSYSAVNFFRAAQVREQTGCGAEEVGTNHARDIVDRPASERMGRGKDGNCRRSPI